MAISTDLLQQTMRAPKTSLIFLSKTAVHFIPITRAYILFNIGPYVITMHKKMGKEHPTAPQYFAQGNMATKLNNEANITIIVFLFILLYAINMEFPRFCIEGIVVHTKIIKVM